ncbi:DUF2125 domain-containing protein [Planktothrix agardhii 1811]|uniref:DUF2125 domain-containing protein n=1 Tax=Planktothrix agardhii TaxID=1160 RepID=UPI001F3E64A8|nr:DUF2125 domain-containing protein [Planktothrix agardhii]MCF3580046.1 DUF2125 domain-containing protein [Planktothrix agardhii 1811]
MPRRLLLGSLLGLVALAAGHAVLWRAMASELESGWQSWVSVRRAQGWRVEHAPPVRGGWPLSATLTLDRLRLEGGAATLPGGMALAAERMELRVSLPWLDRLLVSLPGQQRLWLGGAEFPFTADTLQAVVPLEPGTPPSTAEMFAERLRIGTPAGGLEIGSARLAVEGSASATEAEAALALALSAAALDLPVAPSGTPGFGRRIESLSADLALSGPLPPGRAPAARAEAWRDGGGTLELRTLALRWGPVGAAAAATLAFDEALQPMGAGTLRLTGAEAALEALAEAGVIGRRAAQTARAVVPLLSRPNAEDGQPEIEVPLTLEDRTLALARIPVLRLAPLDWPGR